MSFLNSKSQNGKCYLIHIKTYDAELELPIECNSKGSKLFESLCASLGLRETWYFGLTYESIKYNGCLKWLKMNKKLCDLKLIKHANNTIKMFLLIKFYPEDINSQLIQDYTQHLFYLQAREQIIKETIYSPAELCILLASYSAQAKFGDYSETNSDNNQESHSNLNSFLVQEIPKSIVSKFQMSENMWAEKIKSCWSSHNGMLKEEAELEYLKHISSLEMYGVSYFEIKNKKGTELWLGIDASGLKIYPKTTKLQPEIGMKWNEIVDIVVNSNKFSIKVDETSKTTLNNANNSQNSLKSKKISTFSFYVINAQINSKLILDYCIGYHELYARRIKQDSIDIQQMKQQASEIKMRRQYEKSRLQHEKQLRIEAERKRDELESKLIEYEKQVKSSQDALIKAEETANLLNERVVLAEEETKLLSIKTSKLEAQINLYKVLAEKKEKEKRYFEFKTAESELILNHVLDKQRSNNSLNNSDLDRTKSNLNLAIDDSMDNFENGNHLVRFSHISMAESLNHINTETYKLLKEKLSNLKDNIQEARNLNKITLNDSVYDKNFEDDDNKYSTLKRIRSGSPRSRVNKFDFL